MQPEEEKDLVKAVVEVTHYTVYISLIAVVCMGIIIVCLFDNGQGYISSAPGKESTAVSPAPVALAAPVAGFSAVAAGNSSMAIPADAWKAPDESTIPAGKSGEMIRYGKELLVHTSKYFGPQGIIVHITNGMNCQNCHLTGGTKLFGNDYASFIASYPKMSGRSGKVEPASERIAECFERSLAGKVPDTSKKEVQSILAYMKWIGKGVKKGQKLFGNATEKLAFMNHAADPAKGREVFMMKCQTCHGSNGEGLIAADKKGYTNPPVWGKYSYNDGAGMYRLTNLAGFVKNNMPFGATYQNPQLTDEEAWNVASFINTQRRPHRDQHNDWKDLKNKPMDFPFGPYADTFSEKQHKFGLLSRSKTHKKN